MRYEQDTAAVRVWVGFDPNVSGAEIFLKLCAGGAEQGKKEAACTGCLVVERTVRKAAVCKLPGGEYDFDRILVKQFCFQMITSVFCEIARDAAAYCAGRCFVPNEPMEGIMIQTKTPETGLSRNRHDIDMLAALGALSVMPLFLYGYAALWLLLTAIVTATVVEYVCLRMRGVRRREKGDFSHLITAFITALLLPASAPVWTAAVAVAFGLCIAKHPFGGRGVNIFNPAAAGVAFVTLCWPEFLTKYPLPFSRVDDAFSFGTSPASTLRVGGTPKIEFFDLLLGKFAGPMGATFVIILAACLLFLAFRRTACLRAILPVIFVVGTAAVFFPRLTTGRINSLEFEFASGALLFGLTFMTSDPSTLPDKRGGQIVYGFLLGIFIVLFRRFGVFDVEFVYAVLLANALSSSCDRYAAHIVKLGRDIKNRLAGGRIPHGNPAEEKAGENDA